VPHILFSDAKKLKTPFEQDGVFFNFISNSVNFNNPNRRVEHKIGVKYDNKEFLLTLKPKGEHWLLKADKTTRITPISLVKDAINAYAKAIDADIIFSNTHNDFSQKSEPQKEFLKTIDYFVSQFQTTKEVQIEIGFGSGRHLLYQAQKNPEILFIGLEIHTPSIEQLLKQIKLQNIENILVLNYDARLFMEFIESNSVGKIFVHFPVPWDKKPHRRVYSDEFINEALRILKCDGTLELRTDSRKYFDYCISLLTQLPKGQILIDINKDLDVSSKYEDRWKKQGKTIYDVILKCTQNDEKINIQKDFSFTKDANFDKIKEEIITKPIIEDGFVLHIEEMFEIEPNAGLIQVTYGSFNKPVNKFILIDHGKIRYFQGAPIPTSANFKAHLKLQEILSHD
jgi:tRNA (guanine-N7-)-methyltransferase